MNTKFKIALAAALVAAFAAPAFAYSTSNADEIRRNSGHYSPQWTDSARGAFAQSNDATRAVTQEPMPWMNDPASGKGSF